MVEENGALLGRKQPPTLHTTIVHSKNFSPPAATGNHGIRQKDLAVGFRGPATQLVTPESPTDGHQLVPTAPPHWAKKVV